MNVCEFCGREIPRGRLCTKHLAMRVLLPIRYWQMVAKSANEAAIREQMDLEYEQRRSAEASKALTAERAEAAEAKENMESAMRALEQVRAELEQVRAELKEEHIRRLEEQMEVRNLEKVLAGGCWPNGRSERCRARRWARMLRHASAGCATVTARHGWHA